MSTQNMFTPETVFNLIANNPQGRLFVENLAKMNQLQQAAQQFAPQIQQFTQNPAQAMQTIGNWAQGAVNQMESQQPQQLPQNAQPQGGGAPMNNNILGMAMDTIAKFEATLKRMEEAITVVSKNNDKLLDWVADLAKDNEKITEALSEMKDSIGKIL